MDPTLPEFRPRARSESTEPRRPTGNDPQWRTTCRTCGEAFKSRNQLMRHLYRSHPGKPGKSKTPAKAPRRESLPPPPTPLTQRPAAPKPQKSQSQSQVHPFSLLADQGKLAFVGRVMVAIFAVGMKQLEEEHAQQRGQNHGHESEQPLKAQFPAEQETALPTSNSSALSGPQTGMTAAAALEGHGQMYQGQQGNSSGSEDSDDEDGGAALYGPAPEELPLRLGETGGELDGLDQIDDLD
ncbi:hypothetical protein B0I37DRAFT_215455 [Chaetomium sp. MPI-CAGE-AT-0009]|nr:hypothetical protein B0I37DRAFT_215455 [Chaetomium sp. MPI-CAGE-AT-0009]